jgi:hypothetical protein
MPQGRPRPPDSVMAAHGPAGSWLPCGMPASGPACWRAGRTCSSRHTSVRSVTRCQCLPRPVGAIGLGLMAGPVNERPPGTLAGSAARRCWLASWMARTCGPPIPQCVSDMRVTARAGRRAGDEHVLLAAAPFPGRLGSVSADLLCVDVGHGGAGSVKSVVGNALAHVLVRPGGVVMRLVFGQDSAQMSLAEDQHAVEEFAAQDADEAFADRVHARRLDSGPQDPAASCLENGVEGGAAPDRRRRHAGSPTRWTALPARRAWSVRRGCGGIPTADSPSPGERQGGRCPGPSAGGRAGAACSCRTCPRPACGARPAASLASRGRSRSSACGICAVPARRTTPGRLAYTGPGRRAGVAPRSRAGAPAAQHPSRGPCGIPGQPGRVPGERAGRRS